jgi:hypothetical protein
MFLTGRLHDAVPSAIRSGVASGVGTFTWLTFLPFALVFGLVSERAGVHTAGWMIVAGIALAGGSPLRMTLRRGARLAPVQTIETKVTAEPAPALAA